MNIGFSNKIKPFVEAELKLAIQARKLGDHLKEFKHLENAHVLGQESTYFHVYTHICMFNWACRNKDTLEFFGQIFRIVGAATKTFFGLIPHGNTGGSNVSPFKVMPIDSTLALKIEMAKSKI